MAINGQKATWVLLALDDFKAINSRPNVSRITKKTFDKYQDHFQSFIKADFEAMSKQLRAALRLALMQKGVYVKKRNANFAANLADFVNQ